MALKYNAFQGSSLYLLLWKQFASFSINFSESQKNTPFQNVMTETYHNEALQKQRIVDKKHKKNCQKQVRRGEN